MDMQTKKRLNNGIFIPVLGFGTCNVSRIPSSCFTAPAVKLALEAGYRLIDTATCYGNEAEVGKAIRESNVPREDMFVITKLWNEDQRRGTQREAFENSLNLLGLDYIDLYLVHWPIPEKIKETWSCMEELYAKGKVKAIGVSNFEIDQLEELFTDAKIRPSVNQFEIHPRNTRKELIKFCKENGIVCQACSPLNRGLVLDNEALRKISKKYNKSVAQTILRWDVQNEIIPIPGAVDKGLIIDNTKIFDFSLTDEEMKAIDELNEDFYEGDPHNVTW